MADPRPTPAPTPDVVRDARPRPEEPPDPHTRSAREVVACIVDEIAGYESRLAGAAGMYAEGQITSAQLRVISGKLKHQVDAARAKLSLGERGARLPNVTANAADLVERWDSMTTEAKHAVIASLIDRVEILPGVRGSHHVDVESRVRVHWIA